MQLKRKSLRAAVAVGCLFLGAASVSQAATLYVPSGYSTIQDAIDASSSGDDIQVASGTYNEDIDFNNKNITLESVSGYLTTFIQGTGTGSVVTFGGSETASCYLIGFTISYGDATNGGGINGAGCDATISSCYIHSNAAYNGGGIYDCDGSIANCWILNNAASNVGGGLNSCGGTLQYCSIYYNEAGVNGGGLAWCNAWIGSCTISENEAGSYGGGMHVCDGDIHNCTISLNTADNSGGGLSNCDGTIDECTIESNYAATHGGGMLQCWGLIEDCDILSNTVYNGNGAGIFSCDDVRSCTIHDNYTMNGSGGAIYNSLYVVNCDIYENFSGSSNWQVPGVHAIRSNVEIIGCTFALHDGGDGNPAIAVKDDTTSEVRNCIFAESYDGATDADYEALEANDNAHYCIFSDGAPEWDPSNLQDSQYNTTADPGFVSLGTDHSLSSTSMAIGYAEVLSSTTYPDADVDLEGTARGTSWDAGAYQY